MKNTFLKSAGAIAAGFFAAALLSIATDVILEQTGVMKTEPFNDNPGWLIFLVIVYRFVYNTAGCYLAALLAPNRPMRHAMIIGFIGFFLSILGAVVMWDKVMAVYNISIIVIALPCAWIGGKLGTKKTA